MHLSCLRRREKLEKGTLQIDYKIIVQRHTVQRSLHQHAWVTALFGRIIRKSCLLFPLLSTKWQGSTKRSTKLTARQRKSGNYMRTNIALQINPFLPLEIKSSIQDHTRSKALRRGSTWTLTQMAISFFIRIWSFSHEELCDISTAQFVSYFPVRWRHFRGNIRRLVLSPSRSKQKCLNFPSYMLNRCIEVCL